MAALKAAVSWEPKRFTSEVSPIMLEEITNICSPMGMPLVTNNLTNAYREVHEHLVRGAQTLCADSKRHGASNPAHAFLSLEAPRDQYSRQNPALLNDASFLASVEPPRDYATKNPDDKGTLDEDFGFK